jgi:hypothetical protein
MGVSSHSIEVIRQECEKRLFWKAKIAGESKNGKPKLRTKFLTRGLLGKVSTEVRTRKHNV